MGLGPKTKFAKFWPDIFFHLKELISICFQRTFNQYMGMILKQVIAKYALWTKKAQISIQPGIKIEIESRNAEGNVKMVE